MSPRELRIAAGLSQDRMAVAAGVSSPTVRIYEIDCGSISNGRKRAALDAAYAELQKQLEAGRSQP